MRALLLAATLLVPTFAAGPTPAGRWRTFDDKTHKPRSVVAIYEKEGRFFGRVESSVDPKERTERCDQCHDERRNQPVIGLVILRRMEKRGDEYTGGDILDPETGSVYRCKLKLLEGGAKLQVRGFLGISLFGRSQVWVREP